MVGRNRYSFGGAYAPAPLKVYLPTIVVPSCCLDNIKVYLPTIVVPSCCLDNIKVYLPTIVVPYYNQTRQGFTDMYTYGIGVRRK